MIEGRVIVCIANSWDYDPTSKHHVARILGKHNEVIWVEYHGTRRPRFRAGDARTAWSALRRAIRGAQQVGDSMLRVTPVVIPGATHPRLRQLHERLLLAQIRRAVRRVNPDGVKPVQVWSFAPDVPFLVGRLDEECFVYYCVDEYQEFEDFDRAYIAAAEAELLRRADVIVTSSQLLWEKKRRIRPGVELVRHGVDYDHFASAWRCGLARPSDLAAVPRPIFGFFGLVHHWVDLELLAAAARMRPFYSFVLLGERKVDTSALKNLHNVFLLGRRPYAALPAYCAHFDAGMLLFKCNEMTRHVNPIKMLEYLAAGLPIVSTPLPEAERFRGPIAFAPTPPAFAAACDRFAQAGDASRRRRISAMVRGETWESRVAALCEIVENRCAVLARAESRTEHRLRVTRTRPAMGGVVGTT